MRPLLQTLLEEFHYKLGQTKDSFPRTITFPEIQNKIKVAVGMRRVGKTYCLLQKIRKLLQQDIAIESILYINFEDDRLSPCSSQQAANLLDSFYSLYPENHNRLCYLFLDEIQNVEEWPKLIRRFHDTKQVQIYLSGSSAKLLSTEIATALRGRSLATEIWPLSFKEYLKAKNIKIPTDIVGQKTIDRLTKQLVNYLNEGGFPETIQLQHDDRYRILQDYVNIVIFRDIIERHHISNTSLIRYLIKTLLQNCSSNFSVNKFFNDAKSNGYAISKSTIYDYLEYIEDSYLTFNVPLFSESIRKKQTNPKKIYAIDSGLVHAYSTSFSQNIGRMFENLVYLDLRRRGDTIHYYLTKDRYEVDFVSQNNRGEINLYQVVWDTDNQQTMKRETRALKQAEQELGVKGQIITPKDYLQNLFIIRFK